MIRTPATEGDLLAEDHQMRTIAQAIPLGRIGHPEEVARCALFLASDDASYVTGGQFGGRRRLGTLSVRRSGAA